MTSKDLVYEAKNQVRSSIAAALKNAALAGELPDCEAPAFTVEIPSDVSHGDFATNIAMVGAKAYKMPPAKIAGIILARLDLSESFFERAEMAGPGFINLFLSREWFSRVVEAVLELQAEYGRTSHGGGKKVMVEFVSANPTGPMHMGNARGGVLGDTLAAALDAAGYNVSREFYINDAGNQIEKFGLSLEARYLQIFLGEEAVAFPEDGYHGDDITERAKEFAAGNGDKFVRSSPEERRAALVGYALPQNLSDIKETLSRYRVEYDSWFHESSLYESGLVDKVMEILREKGLTYELDGALWYKATAFGAEKDEVLIRQNGNATYFAADIAYHYDKFAVRGFETVIDVWGADHHGHVARLKAAMDAVGLSGDNLDIVLMQLVRLMKDGEPYRMSKRSGKSITLVDLLELVPVDAARFFFNMREPGSAMDFDLDLAAEQSSQNPVYYVQYAHARICSIMKKLAEEKIEFKACERGELDLLTAPEETELIRHLATYPSVIIGAADRYDPACLTHYASQLATMFHKFYTACHVRVENEALMRARVSLCIAAKTTIANVLALMKIDAPESM